MIDEETNLIIITTAQHATHNLPHNNNHDDVHRIIYPSDPSDPIQIHLTMHKHDAPKTILIHPPTIAPGGSLLNYKIFINSPSPPRREPTFFASFSSPAPKQASSRWPSRTHKNATIKVAPNGKEQIFTLPSSKKSYKVKVRMMGAQDTWREGSCQVLGGTLGCVAIVACVPCIVVDTVVGGACRLVLGVVGGVCGMFCVCCEGCCGIWVCGSEEKEEGELELPPCRHLAAARARLDELEAARDGGTEEVGHGARSQSVFSESTLMGSEHPISGF